MRTMLDNDFLDTFIKWAESTPGVDHRIRDEVRSLVANARATSYPVHPPARKILDPWEETIRASEELLDKAKGGTPGEKRKAKRAAKALMEETAQRLERLWEKSKRGAVSEMSKTRPVTKDDRDEAKQALRSILVSHYSILKASTRKDLTSIIGAFLLRNQEFMESFCAVMKRQNDGRLLHLGERFRVLIDQDAARVWTPEKPLPVRLRPGVKAVRLATGATGNQTAE